VSVREEYLGLLIAAARRRLKQAVLARVARYRLNTQQFWMLLRAAENPGAGAGELAHLQRVDAPTASRVFSALARRRLLRLVPDAEDRRRTRVFLTPAGETLAEELQPVARSIRAAVVSGLTPEEQRTLRASLHKVIANLEHLEDGDDDQTGRAARRLTAAATNGTSR
jgi:DNA-binding MarR family transcriptional regulator